MIWRLGERLAPSSDHCWELVNADGDSNERVGGTEVRKSIDDVQILIVALN